jgi:predicted dehydrogenase
MTRPIRIGVAGLGAVAQSVHLPLIARRWDLFELVAVADLSPALLSTIGEQYRIDPARRHGRFEDMIAAGGLDGVLILTSGSHGTPALQAIEAGIAVFCEKPIAFSRSEIDLIEAAEAAAGRPMLLLAYMKEYDPALTRLRDALPDPAAVRYVEVEVLHPSAAAQLAFANLRPPAGDIPQDALLPLIARDGLAIDAAIGTGAPRSFRSLYTDVIIGSLIHDISALRSLLGPITGIDSARQWGAENDAGSIEVTGTIAENARLNLHWHYLPDYPSYHETITIHHLTGSFQLEFTVPYLLNAPTELRIVERDGVGESRRTVRDVTEAFETELIAFHRLAADGVAAPTGAAQGRLDLDVAQRIARALGVSQGVPVTGEAAGS